MQTTTTSQHPHAIPIKPTKKKQQGKEQSTTQ